MKKIFVLILLLIPTSAISKNYDNIYDFEIDGIAMGESLLNYYSLEEINNFIVTNYPSSDKFIELSTLAKSNSNYYQLNFSVKNDDNKFILYGLSGYMRFNDAIDDCLNHKDKIVKDLKNLVSINLNEYTYNYDKIGDGKNYAYVNDYELQDGSIRVFCNEWSKNTKSLTTYQFNDSFSISIDSNELLDFLSNEAYN